LCNLRKIEALPVTSQQIKIATQRDPVLSKIKSYVLKGWPDQVPKSLQAYRSKIAELTVEEGCLLWGGRVVIPQSLKDVVKAELHKEHLGISKMKALARGHVWWAGIDKELEALAKSCTECAAVKQSPAKAPLHPWGWPRRPWQRIHIDFAGPFMDKSFFIVVDAYSKWAEVVIMPQTTTVRTIAALRQLFSVHGLPEEIVSDNGPQFTSAEFAEFTRKNGIKHTRSSPYHPASNGEAERFVRTFKESMKAGKNDGLTLPHRLASFLLTYRTTPHSTTGTPPCELLMGRSLRTRWDLLKPNTRTSVCRRQAKQKEQHDQHARPRNFYVGQSVMARNFGSGDSWVSGVIVRQLGPVTYLVNVSDGRVWKRHVDHLKELVSNRDLPVSESDFDMDLPSISTPDRSPTEEPEDSPDNSNSHQSESGGQVNSPSTSGTASPSAAGAGMESPAAHSPTPPRRYPSRQRQPPSRLSETQTW
jgi:hypothetical protein